MEKPKIVIVDTDEDYIVPLEYKMISEWGDKADLEIITSLKYFNEFFSAPKTIYILMINEYLYSDKIRKHHISHTFLLREEEYGAEAADSDIYQSVYKYSGIKEIYAKISRVIRQSKKTPVSEKTKLYVTYSAGGGNGKTILSLALAQSLSDFGKKVLYISGEDFQDFYIFMENAPAFCQSRIIYDILAKMPGIVGECMTQIESADFDYLRPLEQPLVAYQLTQEHYRWLLKMLRQSRLYDVIVFESSVCFSDKTIHLFEDADKVFLICSQGQSAVCKFSRLYRSMTIESEKFLIICSRYDRLRKDWMKEEMSHVCALISEYVDEQEEPLDLKKAKALKLLKKTVYSLE